MLYFKIEVSFRETSCNTAMTGNYYSLNRGTLKTTGIVQLYYNRHYNCVLNNSTLQLILNALVSALVTLVRLYIFTSVTELFPSPSLWPRGVCVNMSWLI